MVNVRLAFNIIRKNKETRLNLTGRVKKRWREEENNLYEGWIDNNIGDEGVKTLGEALRINTSLTRLYLNSDEEIRDKIWHERTKVMIQWEWKENNIGPEGVKSLSESLKINTTLTELNLNGDDNIKESNRKRKKEEKNNEQITK